MDQFYTEQIQPNCDEFEYSPEGQDEQLLVNEQFKENELEKQEQVTTAETHQRDLQLSFTRVKNAHMQFEYSHALCCAVRVYSPDEQPKMTPTYEEAPSIKQPTTTTFDGTQVPSSESQNISPAAAVELFLYDSKSTLPYEQ